MSATSTKLASFPSGFEAVVVGASGGIGKTLAQMLCDDPAITRVIGTSRRALSWQHPKLQSLQLDLLDEASIATLAEHVLLPRLVIIATGMLHESGVQPEKSWRALSAENMARSYAINAIGPALLAKHLLPKLPREGKSVFAALSARVGSISDNHTGGWHSYRASKAALNQLIRTCAHELAVKNKESLCVALHPGTVDTHMSKPFSGQVPEGKLFTPDYAAAALLKVIDGISAADSGSFFAWDGSSIPY
jgi:NAD(P)-dependent dehydrogenase (short-subunit alcohol dehydrogenase family)